MMTLVPQVRSAASQLSASPFQVVDPAKSDTPFTWEEMKAGTAVITILNSSNEDQAVSITVLGFTDPVKGGSLGEVVVVPGAQKLSKLEVTRLTLKMRAGPNAIVPTGGLYSGAILIQDASKAYGLLIRQVTVKVSSPQPAVSKLTMVAWRFVPFMPIWFGRAKVPMNRSDFLPTGGSMPLPIGFVQRDGGGRATVLWESTEPAGQASSVARIKISCLPHSGKYDGEVSFNSEDNKTGVVNLTVIARDIVIWPILVLAIGIYIAFEAKRYLGVLRITWNLRQREAAVGEQFRDAQEQFAKAAQGTSFAAYSIAEDVARQREKIRELLNAVESSTWSTDLTNNTDYKQAVTALQTVQSQVAAWGHLGPELSALADSLDSLVSNVAANLVTLPPNSSEEPVVVTQTRELLTGEKVAGADLDSLRKSVADATAMCSAWDAANQRAKNVASSLVALQKRDLNDAQREVLSAVKDQMVGVWIHLWKAQDIAGVTSISANGSDLDSAEISVARIDSVTEQPERIFAFSAERAFTLMPVQAISPSSFAALSDMNHLPANDDRRFDVLARSIRYGDRGSAILAFVLALLTGLNSNYLGKPFGTLQDYITLFLWGAGTKATLDIVTAVLDKFSLPAGTTTLPH